MKQLGLLYLKEAKLRGDKKSLEVQNSIDEEAMYELKRRAKYLERSVEKVIRL